MKPDAKKFDDMKTGNNDILADAQMKKTPFDVPEGYFDTLKIRLRSAAHPRRRSYIPYMVAASAALLLTFGGFHLGRSFGDGFSEEDYILFSDDMTSTIYYEDAEQLADAQELTREDIIEYLIDIGVEIEELEEDTDY